MKWFKRKSNKKESSENEKYFFNRESVYYQTEANLLKIRLKSTEEENEKIKIKLNLYREMISYLFHYEAAYHLSKDNNYEIEILMINDWDYGLKREHLLKEGFNRKNYLYSQRHSFSYDDPLQLSTIKDDWLERSDPIEVFIRKKTNQEQILTEKTQ